MTSTGPVPDATNRRTARLLVAGQAALLAALAVLPRRHDWPLPPVLRATAVLLAGSGVGVVAAASTSLGKGLTALPIPNERAELRTGGLYRYVRHPVYTGVLSAALARTVLLRNRWAVPVTAGLVALLTVKARFEEAHLRARFAGYDAYARRTPRFAPSVRRPGQAR
jgi:protein-S-isoprenylcysteine O-methyltransferase Ste14